jgi:predicted phage replisome organizer
MFDNKKIKQIRKLPEGNNIVLIWVMLLSLAGRCNSNGFIFITENIPYNIEMLSTEVDMPVNTVQFALSVLEKFGMINFTENALSITNWEEYQNKDKLDAIREYNRLAKQKQREKQKLLGQGQCQGQINDSQDTDIDIDKDKELDIDKEIKNDEHAATKEPKIKKIKYAELSHLQKMNIQN